MNALAFAFFAPAPLANINCDFTDDDSPCIKPAQKAPQQNTLNWVKTTITNTVASLKNNLSPSMKKPIYFISFGGSAEGGTGWDSVFNDVTKATRFGTNAATLVKQIEKDTKGVATIGIDLDAEGIAQMAQFGAFAEAFRKGAAFDTYPLMLCAFSDMMSDINPDNFKSDIIRNYGPKGTRLKAINFLNMMVDDNLSTCSFMAQFWINTSLDNLISPANRIFDIWGINQQLQPIQNPGCDGPNGLFNLWKSNGAGIGVWQWSAGNTTPLQNIVAKIKQLS